jgi:hypothetical protein
MALRLLDSPCLRVEISMMTLRKLALRAAFIVLSIASGFVNSTGRDFVEFQLSGKDSNKNQVNFTLPVPNNLIDSTNAFTLMSDDKVVEFKIFAHSFWPSIDGSSSYIRGLTVSLNKTADSNTVMKLNWGKGGVERLALTSIPDYDINTFTVAKLNKDWLSQILYTPVLANTSTEIDWFNKYRRKFAEFIVDESAIALSKKNKLSFESASPWLYDRPYTLYQLYLKTGDLRWRKEAHKSAQRYANNISEDGYFKLKKRKDLKYLMATGLLLDHLFYPSKKTQLIIKRMYDNALHWPVQYSENIGFWTERHLASALELALVNWELEPTKSSHYRLDALISGIYEALLAQAKNNSACLKHPYSAHENHSDNAPVCSPWMSALVVDKLWRYHWLTGDLRSKKIINMLADEFIKFGTYPGKSVHLKGYTIPKYLIFYSASKYNQPNQWTDIQHACDITGMLARSAYLKKRSNKTIALDKDVIEQLLKTCKKTLKRAKVVKVWSVSPLRKFNWWFSTTGDLEWLIEQL